MHNKRGKLILVDLQSRICLNFSTLKEKRCKGVYLGVGVSTSNLHLMQKFV